MSAFRLAIGARWPPTQNLFATESFIDELAQLAKAEVGQSNFTDSRLLSLAAAPAMEIVVVGSNEAPGGVGEEAFGLLAPALANAFFAATGKRFTELPLSKAGLRLA